MPSDRRQFLSAVFAGSTGLALERLPGASVILSALAAEGFGPVAPTPAEGTGEVLLAVPKGFRYSILSRPDQRMSDGNMTPGKPDGMATFIQDGLIRIVRNHEKSGASEPIAPFSQAYDRFAGGGCTTLIVDPVSRRLIADFVSLNGTFRNCNGGPTPWGSWISGEETVAGLNAKQARPHGYCFEVPASANGPVAPVPLKAMGRFTHEAVAVDPVTGVAYMTEDLRESGFYRFLPAVPGNYAAGGRLQMLAIAGRSRANLVEGVRVGESLRVEWVDIADPDPADAETRPDAVFQQGRALGGAAFRHLEGAVYAPGGVYFASTSGGKPRLGQIWRYNVGSGKRRSAGPSAGYATLTLVYEATDRSVLGFPDNLCLGPNGTLLICEDGGDVPQSLRVYTPRGEIFEVVRNMVPGFEKTELAGVRFSPDGATMFLNALAPGYTFAIWGPWDRL
jgi:hypothetical protein